MFLYTHSFNIHFSRRRRIWNFLVNWLSCYETWCLFHLLFGESFHIVIFTPFVTRVAFECHTVISSGKRFCILYSKNLQFVSSCKNAATVNLLYFIKCKAARLACFYLRITRGFINVTLYWRSYAISYNCTWILSVDSFFSFILFVVDYFFHLQFSGDSSVSCRTYISNKICEWYCCYISVLVLDILRLCDNICCQFD